MRTKLQNMAETMGRELRVSSQWQSPDLLDFKGTGISGRIFLNEAQRRLEIEVQKSFLMPISNDAIAAKINAYLDEEL